jgi:hypothetical protein
MYDLEPQPEYCINTLDNKLYPEPAEQWLQIIVQMWEYSVRIVCV